ncbi:hypothetical protein VPG91_11720 [Nitrospirillum amazonense]|uniref:hypothetical protein n=1 Tax=Nitrospirillum amazonense TaxID=28077 RepID=UPI002DD43C98|nr:hypothetical protein [Nitrospirillum amazonense]MEC4591658.1 hypothetical protein [Nitrospirillum amazonense]
MKTGKKETVLVAEIDPVELTCRIVEALTWLRRPPGATAAQALATVENPELLAGCERAALAAAKYLAECVNAGQQPT